MLKMIAFDLDGTLGDTIAMCIQAFRAAVSPYAGKILTDREIIGTFGLNEVGMIKKVEPDNWEAALNDYYKLYEQLHDLCAEPFPGIRELLDVLKGKNIRLALITGKARRSCGLTLEKFGLSDYFSDVMTGSEIRPNKAELMLELLDKYELAASEFRYVGDATSDIAASRQAGVRCLSAAWSGGAELEELQALNRPYVFESIDALKKYLNSELMEA